MPLVLLEITRQVANAANFASHRGKIMFVKNPKLVSGNLGGLLHTEDTDSFKSFGELANVPGCKPFSK